MSRLPVMEDFYTLQGEGFHSGKAAYFIRLGGCDVGCFWCDVKESWDAQVHPQVEIDELVHKAKAFAGKIIVITGGEPLMHPLGELTQKLKEAGFRCHIETSGAHPLSGTWDWICVSPKKFKPCRSEVLPLAHELKIIVYNQSDFEFAEEHRKHVGKDCKLYLQPEWSKMEELSPLIVEYIKNNPAWELSLQTHKFLDIP